MSIVARGLGRGPYEGAIVAWGLGIRGGVLGALIRIINETVNVVEDTSVFKTMFRYADEIVAFIEASPRVTLVYPDAALTLITPALNTGITILAPMTKGRIDIASAMILSVFLSAVLGQHDRERDISSDLSGFTEFE